MVNAEAKSDQRQQRTRSKRPTHGRLLVVEPDELTRWSISTYLSDWFEVESAPSVEPAERVLAHHAVNALVVCDELPVLIAEDLEIRARLRNPALTVVRTATDVTGSGGRNGGPDRLEKPFNLARLAHMLGVSDDELAAGEAP